METSHTTPVPPKQHASPPTLLFNRRPRTTDPSKRFSSPRRLSVGTSADLSVFMIYVCLFACVLVYPLHVDVCSFVDLSVHLSVYVCLSACLLACLSVCPFVRLPASMFLYDRQTDRRTNMQSAWDRKADRTDRNELLTVGKVYMLTYRHADRHIDMRTDIQKQNNRRTYTQMVRHVKQAGRHAVKQMDGY